MPEGDRIHKIANWMAPRLTEDTLRSVTLAGAQDASQCRGRRVSGVRAVGKHLFIELDNNRALRSHLGMYGSWHFYGKGERWKKPRWQASIVLETATCTYVCFNARDVEVVASPSVRERIIDTRLGPDLVRGPVDAEALAARALAMLESDDLVGDALLDQRVAAGIGNVYKSEVLFIKGFHPNRPLNSVTVQDLAKCFQLAAKLLRNNLGGGKRVTRSNADGAGRLWVYGRTGLPCLKCDTPVAYRRLGRHHRGTYWCPECQE